MMSGPPGRGPLFSRPGVDAASRAYCSVRSCAADTTPVTPMRPKLTSVGMLQWWKGSSTGGAALGLRAQGRGGRMRAATAFHAMLPCRPTQQLLLFPLALRANHGHEQFSQQNTQPTRTAHSGNCTSLTTEPSGASSARYPSPDDSLKLVCSGPEGLVRSLPEANTCGVQSRAAGSSGGWDGQVGQVNFPPSSNRPAQQRSTTDLPPALSPAAGPCCTHQQVLAGRDADAGGKGPALRAVLLVRPPKAPRHPRCPTPLCGPLGRAGGAATAATMVWAKRGQRCRRPGRRAGTQAGIGRPHRACRRPPPVHPPQG